MSRNIAYRWITALLLTSCSTVHAQELFVFTEPASNMAARSLGVRMNNYIMKEAGKPTWNWHLLPELMWGISQKWMLHAEGFLSNRAGNWKTEGGSLYAKYRFHTQDDIHRHFRMAGYGRFSVNTADIHQEAIDFFGHSSGTELGMIATQLLGKVAVSGSVSWLHAADNIRYAFRQPNSDYGRNALGYSLSVGKLMLPRVYTSYRQTNLNLMLEALGQTNMQSGRSFVDLAPAVQFIFHSRFRLDLAARFPVLGAMERTAPRGLVVRMEYNWFRAY